MTGLGCVNFQQSTHTCQLNVSWLTKQQSGYSVSHVHKCLPTRGNLWWSIGHCPSVFIQSLRNFLYKPILFCVEAQFHSETSQLDARLQNKGGTNLSSCYYHNDNAKKTPNLILLNFEMERITLEMTFKLLSVNIEFSGHKGLSKDLLMVNRGIYRNQLD